MMTLLFPAGNTCGHHGPGPR